MKRKKKEVSSGRKSLQYRGTKCLNCEQPLDTSDVYCPYCSQLNSNKQLSAKDFFGEFVNSIVVYDSRLRNTLKDLLFRPGVITRNYVNGQRLKYANPFRFFLSVSIIFFLLNGFIDIFRGNSEDDAINLKSQPRNAFNLDSLKQTISTSTTDAIRYADSAEAKQEVKIDYLSDRELDSLPVMESYIQRITLYNQFYGVHKIKSADIALDSLRHRKTTFNKWVYSKNTTIEKIKENPRAFVNYILSKIPFFLFFFTPFFALFFLLIYSRKKYTYVEHMVFIFHIFSFIFLAMLIFLIPDYILGAQILLALLFMAIGPFYFYKALRNFYGEGRLITLIKFVFLNIVFGIGLTFSAVIFVAASAAFY